MIFNRNKFFELIKNNSEKAQKLKFKQFILDSLSVSDYYYPKILNKYNSLDCRLILLIEILVYPIEINVHLLV